MQNENDVIVIGGSYAGMAAALQLVRARRQVLVIDSGAPRNRFADHSHGFLAQDGVSPSVIAQTARKQLLAYPTVKWLEGQVTRIAGERDDFVAMTADGLQYGARRILLATGVADVLPDIEGLRERWGRSVFHCPYCHGYELDSGRIGVIATGQMSVHQAELLAEWGEVTLLTNASLEVDSDAYRVLRQKNVTIETRPVHRLEGHAEILLKDGQRLDFAGLFVATRPVPSSGLAEETGCAVKETPMGTQIQTNESRQTSIPGVFACGDVASLPHSISLAVADGALTGFHLHRSLVWPDGAQ